MTHPPAALYSHSNQVRMYTKATAQFAYTQSHGLFWTWLSILTMCSMHKNLLKGASQRRHIYVTCPLTIAGICNFDVWSHVAPAPNSWSIMDWIYKYIHAHPHTLKHMRERERGTHRCAYTYLVQPQTHTQTHVHTLAHTRSLLPCLLCIHTMAFESRVLKTDNGHQGAKDTCLRFDVYCSNLVI